MKTVMIGGVEYVPKTEVIIIDSGDTSIAKKAIGKIMLVRSRNKGITIGEVVDADETGVELKNARRVWYHKPKNKSLAWYEGVALTGLSDDSKVSATMIQEFIIEDYSMTLCTASAIEQIMSKVPHAQS